MNWIFRYELFLFDFDGLLVNTEELHYLAYKKMLADRGFDLKIDFATYCRSAHYEAHALQHYIYRTFPAVFEQEPNWQVLYSEKRNALLELVQRGGIAIMPGVRELLMALDQAGIKRCVVTHSPNALIEQIREQLPILDTISEWITREHYSEPKPASDCYFLAIERFGKGKKAIIGFEDTPRGIWALKETRARPVIICSVDYPELPQFQQEGVALFNSFNQIPSNWGG